MTVGMFKRKSPYPTQQLRIVHEELDRQRVATQNRQSAIEQRAGIILGAAGLSVGFLATRIPSVISASGDLDFTKLLTWTGVAAMMGAALALSSSVLALLCLLPTRGPEVDPGTLRDIALGADVYSVEFRLVQDKIDAHRGDVAVLGKRFKKLVWATWLLVAAWAATVVHLLTYLGGTSS